MWRTRIDTTRWSSLAFRVIVVIQIFTTIILCHSFIHDIKWTLIDWSLISLSTSSSSEIEHLYVFSGRRRLEIRCHGARQVILIQSYMTKVPFCLVTLNTYSFSGLNICKISHRNSRQDSPVDFQLCLRRRHLRDHSGCSKVTLMPFLILFSSMLFLILIINHFEKL